MKKNRLAMLGTGDIANFHYEAFKKAGFDISHCASKKNSQRGRKFAIKNSIKKFYADPHELIENHEEWDIILLAIHTENNIDYYDKLKKLNKLCLIEKPVFTNINSFGNITPSSYPNIRVAYNRRFYKTVQSAKNFINENGPVTCRMELPESVNLASDDKYSAILLNSVHGLDILRYLFDDLEIISNNELLSPNGRLTILKSSKEDIINLLMNWNSPSNFSLSIEAKSKRLELKPFETCKIFEGMEIIEPSKDLPLRRYIPKIIEESSSFPSEKNDIKPGFYEQALEMKNILKGKSPNISSNLYDALKTQEIAQKILYNLS